MDDLTADFLTETYESLQNLEQIILSLESQPENMDLIRDAFRILHTVKGTCGFLGFSRMQAVSHGAENVLSKMRDGKLIASPVITSTLFVALDTIRQIADSIESKGKESEGSDSDLLKALDLCLEEGEKANDDTHDVETKEELLEENSVEATQNSEREESPVSENTFLGEENISSGEPIEHQESEPTQTTDIPLETPLETAPPPVENQQTASVPKNPPKEETAPANAAAANNHAANQSIRINLDVIDNLMNLVGELVLTRNQLLQQNEEAETSNTQNNVLARLSHLTTDLQQNIMKTRMQPIETAWTKLPRLVRDIAGDLQKKIQLKQIGADTELDRQVIELIKDPLVHMVRNSADHGIETPEVRKTAAKNETGTITLKAYHHGGHILINISDDGKGIDPDIIRRKALEKGVVSEIELERMSDDQVLQMIFRPGFSTADKISHISGRGVGMDIVRANIEKLGGTIEMQSKKGVGSTFIIKIPLTLSIISVLLVGVGDQSFAIPQLAITEIVSFKKEDNHQIEYIQDKPLLCWRNKFLPLVYLDEILKMPHHAQKNSQNIIVVQVGSHHFGFIVDSIRDSQEIVVKPLSKKLSHLSIFSGSTILGNGEVVLILDPNNFDLRVEQSHAMTFENQNSKTSDTPTKNTIILIFKSGQATKAVPLALVSRIDEVPVKNIQNINNQYIFLHRDQLIPIMGYTENSEEASDPEALLPILIFTDRGYRLALKIDEIVNIIEDSTEIQLESSNDETLGMAVISGITTSVINCQYYFKKAYPHWHERLGNSTSPKPVKRLLLVDDSIFFHNLISPLLQVSGYVVKTASSADQGLKMCRESTQPYDIIISDIEMPYKNGYDFLAEIKADENLSHIPVIALSANDTEEEIQKSKAAGFRDFVPKTDQQTLIRVLSQLANT